MLTVQNKTIDTYNSNFTLLLVCVICNVTGKQTSDHLRCCVYTELLDRNWGTPTPPPLTPDGNPHRSRSISDVSSFSTVFILRFFYPIRVRALRVEEPQLGCISSGWHNFVVIRHSLKERHQGDRHHYSAAVSRVWAKVTNCCCYRQPNSS